MSSWARPGVECVCISAGWLRGQGISPWKWIALKYLGLPVVGGQYVITQAGADSRGVYVKIKGWDVWIHAENFRPLVKRSQEQDVAMFRHLLKKQPVEA